MILPTSDQQRRLKYKFVVLNLILNLGLFQYSRTVGRPISQINLFINISAFYHNIFYRCFPENV